MHISDGILSSQVIITTSILAVGLFVFSLKDLKNDNISLVSAMSAMFFIASFIHIPIGPTQIHLTLLGVIGMLLGRRVFLSVFIALLLQATLLGFGGLSSLGANLVIMALPSYITFLLVKNGLFDSFNEKVKFFLIGFVAVLLASLLLALMLSLSKDEYLIASYTIILANIPAMIIEGLVTLFLLNYLKKSIPWVLNEAKICV